MNALRRKGPVKPNSTNSVTVIVPTADTTEDPRAFTCLLGGIEAQPVMTQRSVYRYMDQASVITESRRCQAGEFSEANAHWWIPGRPLDAILSVPRHSLRDLNASRSVVVQWLVRMKQSRDRTVLALIPWIVVDAPSPGPYATAIQACANLAGIPLPAGHVDAALDHVIRSSPQRDIKEADRGRH